MQSAKKALYLRGDMYLLSHGNGYNPFFFRLFLPFPEKFPLHLHKNKNEGIGCAHVRKHVGLLSGASGIFA